MTGTTERRFLASTVAAYGSQSGRVLVRIAAELALARLIVPGQWGIFAVARGIVAIAALLRDAGLSYQLVRDPRRPFGTVAAWETAVGALLAAGLVAGAPLWAAGDPGLASVLRVFGLWVFLDGLAAIPKVYFETHLEVGRLVVPELARSGVFAAVSVTLAASGLEVWSLVAGELGAAAFYACVVWWRARRVMPLAVDLGLLPDLLRKAGLLFLIALAAVPVPYVQRFVVAAFDTHAMVGQYDKAFEWAMRLQIFVLPALLRVFYPALVAYGGDRERSVGAYRLGTVSILALETLAAYLLFFNARTILVDILIGDQWGPAVPLLRILCFLPLVDPFTRLGGEVLKVRGEDRLWLLIVVANIACLLGFGIAFARHHGAVGMAWANFLLAGNLLMAWRMKRFCGPQFFALVRDLAFVYLLPLPLFLAVSQLFPRESWGRLAASLVAAALAGVVFLARFQRPFREFFGAAIRPEDAA